MKTTLILDIPVMEKARIAKGLFKNELAQQAGISKASVHRAFGDGNVGLSVARAIAATLGLELGTILIPQRHAGDHW